MGNIKERFLQAKQSADILSLSNHRYQLLYKISEQSRVPIELDFNNLDGKSYEIPCLAANIDNPDYEAYIAIIPGECLCSLYHNYGARLLEQNVRSFYNLLVR